MKKFQSIGVLLSAITLLLVVLLVSVFTYSAGQAYARREDAARFGRPGRTMMVGSRSDTASRKPRRDASARINSAAAFCAP